MRTRNFILICFTVLLIFSPSLFVFFTNDDFFHLKISNARNLNDFINFFNFAVQPGSYGFYRPVTTQLFYFLGRTVFNLDPFYLHLISFLTLFAIIYLIWKISVILTGKERIGFVVAFLYGVSAIHFGHLYYLSAYQELGVTLFFLISLLFLLKFLEKPRHLDYFLSICFFLVSLLSKETAVVFPGIAFITLAYLEGTGRLSVSNKKFYAVLTPFILISLIYVFLHFVIYGTPSGEYYLLNLSTKKMFNTLFWYFGWTMNLPEILPDFIGPGIKVNPNLFRFWGGYMVLILSFLTIFLAITFLSAVNNLYRKKCNLKLFLYCLLWFLITLSPVLFLPIHKFAFYLTLPGIGIYLYLAYVLDSLKLPVLRNISLIFFLLSSLTAVTLTYKTHWTIRGSLVSGRVYKFVEANKSNLAGKTILFYDKPEDSDLPWKPSDVVKVALSDNNFFDVFYNGQIKALYNTGEEGDKVVRAHARIFLGY